MTWNVAAQAHLDAGLPRRVRWLIWAVVPPIGGGAAVGLGFWTGADHETLTVAGAARLYYGGQGALSFDPPSAEGGTDIRNYQVKLGLSAEGETLARGYRLGGAPVEVHLALWNAETMALLDIVRRFKGEIDSAEIPSPSLGENAVLPLSLVSASRRGTLPSAAYKSAASQRLVDATDTFYAHADLGLVHSDPWGAAT